MNAKIGKLIRAGVEVFYINEGGYQEGTVEALEAILNGKPVPAAKPVKKLYSVHVSLQYPTWDMQEGYDVEVKAESKALANKQARKEEQDKHFGCGQVYFKATEK